MNRFIIRTEADVGSAVIGVKACASAMGFSADKQYKLGTAISELAMNIVKYTNGKGGDIVIRSSSDPTCNYDILVQARDNGSGIACVDQALQEDWSTGGTLGLGLPGVRRMVDYFQICSEVGIGTLITIGMNR